jgi:hypothetical protein
MNSKLRIESMLVAALLLCGLGACTTSEAKGGNGGSGVVGGTTVPPGGTGGSMAVAGSTGTSATDGIACPPVSPAPLITDFTYAPSDAGMPDPTQARFGGSGTWQGGTAVWTNSATPFTSDVTQGNWHITGTVDNYSGFNLYFDNCNHIDASAYKGIKFTISGSLGGGTLRMGVGTLNDAVAASWLIANGDTAAKATDAGRCVPKTGTGKYSQTDCKDPEAAIAVTATPTPVTLAWGDFTGGKPVPNVEPTDIISIYWYFVWSTTSYPVDITIDDLSFVP